MTLSFATAGIGQVYLERILGLGYLDTQLKIQVHFLMLIATARCFTLGVGLFIWDFFRYAPRLRTRDRMPTPAPALGRADRARPRPERAVVDASTGRSRTTCLTGDEVAIFEQCHAQQLAVMLKGPTGCGKTRFVEHMAWRLERPLVTISCHDDLTASDLVGRFLIRHDGTRLAGRAADARRARGRALLPRRSRRGAAGHRRRPAPADRPSARAADRQDRRDSRGRARASSW